jgi:hypothetical protein
MAHKDHPNQINKNALNRTHAIIEPLTGTVAIPSTYKLLQKKGIRIQYLRIQAPEKLSYNSANKH